MATKLSEDILVSNYTKYKKRLDSYLGEDIANKIIEELGGEDAVMRASFATTKDTGLAYEGSLCRTILNIATYAVKINDLLPESKQAEKASIVKVALLNNISKVQMFKPMEDEWQRNKRGIMYDFNDKLDGKLRAGERSILIAANCGVMFTGSEYEAMRIMDRANDEDDKMVKVHSSVLSLTIKQATELINAISRTNI
jgi:hypothetical protein